MFHNSDFWLLEIECARGERGGLRIISHSSLLKLLGEAKTMARSFGRICDLEEMECNDKGEGVGHRRWGGDKAIANVERKAWEDTQARKQLSSGVQDQELIDKSKDVVHGEIVVDEKDIDEDCLKSCAVGIVKDQINVETIQQAMVSDGVSGIKVKALGDSKALIIFSSYVEKQAYMEMRR
ncbi:hypothetical protein U1Q18_033970 [Sarracenia purpurea var. burkii]